MNKLRQDINIGVNIRELRIRNSFIQESITTKLQFLGFEDVNRSLYSRYKTGELNIQISHLQALKHIFRCSYYDLLD